jgi:hypothetical protein
MNIEKLPVDYKGLPKSVDVNDGASIINDLNTPYKHAGSIMTMGGVMYPVMGYVVESNRFDNIISYLGTTEKWEEAGFILPDGILVDMSAKDSGGDKGKRNLNHSDVKSFGDTLNSMLDDGAIRVGYGSSATPFVQISLRNGFPTGAQWARIDELLTLKPYRIDLEATMFGSDANNPKTNFYKQYTIQDSVKDMQNDLRAYFNGEKNNIGIPQIEEVVAKEATFPLSFPKGPYNPLIGDQIGIQPMQSLNQGGFIDLNEEKLHTKLSDKLWDEDGKIKKDVREKLLEIAGLFKDSLGLFVTPDIRVTGSLANYNFNNQSDIDLHLVYDFEDLPIDKDILNDFFNAKKQIFNNQYNFKIHGAPVEVGVEDINAPLVSTGIYSLLDDEWIIKPKNAGKEIPDVKLKDYENLVQQIETTIETKDRNQLSMLWNLIRQMRKNSLAKDGEFGEGNLIFKKLRNNGYLKRIKDALNDSISKELSLEMFYRANQYPKTPIPTKSYVEPF